MDEEILLDTIQDLIDSTIDMVMSQLVQSSVDDERIQQASLSSDSSLTSPMTVLHNDELSESSTSTVNEDIASDEHDSPGQPQLPAVDVSNATWSDLVNEHDDRPVDAIDLESPMTLVNPSESLSIIDTTVHPIDATLQVEKSHSSA